MGKRIGDFDEVIAAIALALDREMETRELRFREVAGLAVVGWRNRRGFLRGPFGGGCGWGCGGDYPLMWSRICFCTAVLIVDCSTIMRRWPPRSKLISMALGMVAAANCALW